jgi:hypothetical protein
VLKRVIVVAVIVLAAMLLAKDGRLMRKADLTGSCRTVSTAADGSQVIACRDGKLEGAPTLTSHGCTASGQTGTLQYWRCSASVEASQVGR